MNVPFKHLLSLLLVVSSIGMLCSQAIKFERVYGGNGYDYGYSVQQTYDKGYIVAGATTSFGAGNTDAYILKTDSTGNAKWQRTFGGINIDQARCIRQTNDTGYVIAGFTNSLGYGGYDMYVVKTNKSGDTTWTKTFGGSNWDFAYSIAVTNDGGYAIAGGTYSYGKGNEDMYLVKLNANGDTVWTKTYGGINDDEARSVKQTSDGGYILTGFTKSLGDIDGDSYTIRTDPNGDTLWTYKYSGAQEDCSYDIIENTLGQFKTVGNTEVIGNTEGFSVRISATGNFLSYDYYGGADEDGLNGVAQAPGFGFAVLGYTYSFGFAGGTNDFVLYVLPAGISSNFGGIKMEVGYSIANTLDGGYIMCGTSNSYSSLDHIYLIKTDSSGTSTGIVVPYITDIENISMRKTNFNIYPNPSNNQIFISIPDDFTKTKTSITITDLIGREYNTITIEKNTLITEINTSEIKNGIYLLQLRNKNAVITERFIIQH